MLWCTKCGHAWIGSCRAAQIVFVYACLWDPIEKLTIWKKKGDMAGVLWIGILWKNIIHAYALFQRNTSNRQGVYKHTTHSLHVVYRKDTLPKPPLDLSASLHHRDESFISGHAHTACKQKSKYFIRCYEAIILHKWQFSGKPMLFKTNTWFILLYIITKYCFILLHCKWFGNLSSALVYSKITENAMHRFISKILGRSENG